MIGGSVDRYTKIQYQNTKINYHKISSIELACKNFLYSVMGWVGDKIESIQNYSVQCCPKNHNFYSMMTFAHTLSTSWRYKNSVSPQRMCSENMAIQKYQKYPRHHALVRGKKVARHQSVQKQIFYAKTLGKVIVQET